MTYNTYLMHHGILGQKWGIRRFQKKDGSYTNLGKQHRYEQNKKFLDQEIKTAKKTVNVDSLQQKADKYIDLANEISNDYDALYKSLQKNPQFKKDCLDYLKKEGVDPDSYDVFAMDAVDIMLPKYTPKSILDKRERLEQYSDDYWDELHSYADPIVEKYGSLPVSDFVKGRYNVTAESYIRNSNWDSNQSLMAYMFRHFEDYWVNDLESYYDLESSMYD